MPIDPKKIAEWGKDAAIVTEGVERMHSGRLEGNQWAQVAAVACALSMKAIPALLSDREEMQREIEALRLLLKGGVLDAVKLSGVRLEWRDGKVTVPELAEALAVLRSAEWAGSDGIGCVGECPVCHGEAPNPTRPQGHAPDCRLDALLNPKP